MDDLSTLYQTYMQKSAEQEELTRAMLERIEKDRAANQRLFNQVAEMGFVGKVDKKEFNAFLQKPYDLIPRGKDTYILIVPKFIQFSAGWRMLTNENSEYNHFEITRFTHFLNPLPDWLAEKAGYDHPTWNGFIEGNALVVTSGDAQKVAAHFGKAVAGRTGNRLTLKPASRFDVLRRMIKEDGILPYTTAPIPLELRRDPEQYKSTDALDGSTFQLRPWQQRTYDRDFLEWSRLTVIAWGQTGKSFLGLEACAGLRGRKLILTYRKNLREQWLTRRLPLLSEEARSEVIVDSYHNLHKYRKEKFSLVILDECHHVPANLCIDAAMLDTIAVIGMSASPVREDGNEELIIALCGKPVGLDWEVSDTQKPHVHIWMVKDQAAKYATVQRLSEKPIKGKTFIFTWKLGIGEKIAQMLDVPFVQHKTKNALQVIDDHDTVVVSSVADEGLSAPVDRIIEADFQFGGRAQLFQRYLRGANDTGRKSEFHSIITVEEYARYAKRYLIFEYHGLDIELHDETGRQKENGESLYAVRGKPNKSGYAPLSPPVRVKAGAFEVVRNPSPNAVVKIIEPRRTKASKPQSEVDQVLSNPAVAKMLQDAYAKAGRQVQQEKKIHTVLKLGWDLPVSLEMLKAGKALNARALRSYKKAFHLAEEAGLMLKTGEGWIANKGKLKQVVDLNARFKK